MVNNQITYYNAFPQVSLGEATEKLFVLSDKETAIFALGTAIGGITPICLKYAEWGLSGKGSQDISGEDMWKTPAGMVTLVMGLTTTIVGVRAMISPSEKITRNMGTALFGYGGTAAMAILIPVVMKKVSEMISGNSSNPTSVKKLSKKEMYPPVTVTSHNIYY